MGYLFSYLAENLLILCLTVPTILIALTFHEYAHGYIAYRLGDPTAKRMGRLTLNPLAHLNPLGTICMLLFHIGWANPVPVDCRYFKKPKQGMALVAAAGPLMNLLLSFIGAFCYDLAFGFYIRFGNTLLGVILGYLTTFLFYFHYLNLYLAIFNLIPIPPFDGSRILFLFLKEKYYFGIMKYERYIQIAFLLLFYLGFASGLLSYIVEPLSRGMLSLFSFLIPTT